MKREKVLCLDGIRGLMAINVILCHFVVVYFPQMYYLKFAEESNDFLSLFATTPLSVLINGNIAVQYFFVLSGLLAGKIIFEKDVDAQFLRKRILSRYPRLLPIVVIATLFTFFTMVFGLQKHLDIANDVMNTEFIVSYCNFKPTLKHLILNLFVLPFTDASGYVGPFWTIKYELYGYLMSLTVAYIFKDWKWRKIAYVVICGLFILMLNDRYVSFILGVLLADVLYNDNLDKIYKFYSRFYKSKVFIAICFVIGTFLSCCPMEYVSVYKIFGRIPYLSTDLVRAIGIFIVLYAILRTQKIQQIFSIKPLMFLGEFSFEVYAFHWPIMLSLQAYLFSVFYGKFSYNVSAVLAFVITVPVIYVVSYFVHIGIKKTNSLISFLKKNKSVTA